MTPDRTPVAPTAGRTESKSLTDAVIQAAVRDAIWQTSYKDDTPNPKIGTAPPVAQPGRPPMSQKAVDDSTRMLSAGVASVLFSASGSGLLIASGYANPTTLGLIVAAPAVLAAPILALSRLAKRAKEVVEAAPPEIHNHYNGPVHQDQRRTESKNIGIVAKTINEQ